MFVCFALAGPLRGSWALALVFKIIPWEHIVYPSRYQPDWPHLIIIREGFWVGFLDLHKIRDITARGVKWLGP